ncbi:hypothetical protein POM88_029536 [Heracleum sosnowskyi]|uniref:Uncharacterized protein n=1 Tax=Heracleum sosnowskyi TaxID=360622 RepID=A0AAD8HUY0_9APIA|nr:hypothetical protein POM88_029536 [Heracleum sosnowskyi]
MENGRRIARQRKQSMLVNFLLKRKMTFFIWTLGLCWEAEVANSGNTSNNHLRDTEHQPNRAMCLLFSNVYPPTQIQECFSSKEQKKKKYIRKMYDFIQQGKHAEKRKLEQAAMSKLIEMAYKKQRCVASHPDTRMLFLKGHHLWIIILQCVASHPDTRMLFLKEAREHYQQNNWVYYMVPALAAQPSSRLLKHIIRCYLQLSDDSRACNALRSCFPDMLRDIMFSSCLRASTFQNCKSTVSKISPTSICSKIDMDFMVQIEKLPSYPTIGKVSSVSRATETVCHAFDFEGLGCHKDFTVVTLQNMLSVWYKVVVSGFLPKLMSRLKVTIMKITVLTACLMFFCKVDVFENLDNMFIPCTSHV